MGSNFYCDHMSPIFYSIGSLIKHRLELAGAVGGLDHELALVPLVDQAGVDQLADEVGGHGALLILLLERCDLLLELGDFERLGCGLGLLVGGLLLVGLDLGLGSSSFARHLEHVG